MDRNTAAKLIRIVALAAAVVCLAASLVYSFTGRMIPGLMPLSLAVAMAGVLYAAALRRRAGMVSRGYWLGMLALLLLGIALNAAAGVSQIMNALR